MDNRNGLTLGAPCNEVVEWRVFEYESNASIDSGISFPNDILMHFDSKNVSSSMGLELISFAHPRPITPSSLLPCSGPLVPEARCTAGPDRGLVYHSTNPNDHAWFDRRGFANPHANVVDSGGTVPLTTQGAHPTTPALAPAPGYADAVATAMAYAPAWKAAPPPTLPVSPASLTDRNSGRTKPAKPFSCKLRSVRGLHSHDPTICTSTFKLRKDLERHKRTCHATSDDQFYRCRCGLKCNRKDNYQRHVDNCTKQVAHPTFCCMCQDHCVGKDEHIEHVRGCRNGLRQRRDSRARKSDSELAAVLMKAGL